MRVGNVAVTRLSFRGQALDLAATTRDNVARLHRLSAAHGPDRHETPIDANTGVAPFAAGARGGGLASSPWGDAPVVVQSMTNTDTVDVIETAIQVKELALAGSELVRITVNTPGRHRPCRTSASS